MLTTFTPVPTIAVKDLDRARAFYAGSGSFFVYPSGYAGTNKATAMSFEVPLDAFDAEVGALRAKGLTFQTFEAEGMVWDDGVATMGEMRALWFADPDGNIISVTTPVA